MVSRLPLCKFLVSYGESSATTKFVAINSRSSYQRETSMEFQIDSLPRDFGIFPGCFPGVGGSVLSTAATFLLARFPRQSQALSVRPSVGWCHFIHFIFSWQLKFSNFSHRSISFDFFCCLPSVFFYVGCITCFHFHILTSSLCPSVMSPPWPF